MRISDWSSDWCSSDRRRIKCPAFRRQHDLAGLAHEQGDVEAGLELADLVADRRRRHAQFGCRSLEALPTRGSLEGTQRAELRQTAHQPAPPGESAGSSRRTDDLDSFIW